MLDCLFIQCLAVAIIVGTSLLSSLNTSSVREIASLAMFDFCCC